MPESFLSPSRYVTQDGAVRGVGAAVARLGDKAAVVAGERGLRPVREELEAGLAGAGVAAVWLTHSGPCSPAAVTRLVAGAADCDVVVGVGGGRALDVTKWVADTLGVPYVLVPTSPATCAAATALVVEYSDEGVYQRGRMVAQAAAYSFVDPGVLAAAPDRLLVAGVVDALAKAVEVRYAASRLGKSSAALAAALSLCDALEQELFAGAEAVFGTGAAPGAAGPAGESAQAHPTPVAGTSAARRRLAEVAVLWPGIIGALASEEAKLAAAHAVYNALTLLPGCRAYLHGEVMALGILAQLALEGRPDADLERTARFFALLGCPAGLAGVGCEAYLADAGARQAVLERACVLPSLRAGFPDAGPGDLAAAVARADEVARAALRPT
jgi:glycerol dehydrogenase